MASGSVPSKPTSRNRLSLILHLASPVKAEEVKQAILMDCDSDHSSSIVATANPSSSSSPARSPPSTPRCPEQSPVTQNGNDTTQSNACIPPTPVADASDSRENMKLLRKARKLSRVFTAAPTPPANFATTETHRFVSLPRENQESPPPLSRSNSHTKRRKLRRTPSAAAPSNPSSPTSIDLNRWKSLLSPRPAFSIPPRTSSSSASAVPSNDTTEPPASRSLRSPSTNSSADLYNRSAISLVAELDSDQRKRARFKRLSRRFGGNASSTSISERFTENAAASMSMTSLHDTVSPGQGSLRKAKDRRKSFDLSSLTQPLASPASPAFSFLQRDPSKSLKRSRSMWALKGSGEEAEPDFSQRDHEWEQLRSTIPKEPMGERQRLLNVKRAQKMRQLFGTEPPPALFQITNLGEGDQDSLFEGNRESLATILSIPSTANLLSSPKQQHKSLPVPVHSKSLHTAASEAGDHLPSDNSLPTLIPQPSSVVATCDSKDKDAKPDQVISPSAEASNSSQISIASTPSETSVEFRLRRRRAAKLSRFFGIGYQDLSAIPMPEVRPSTSDATISQAHPELIQRPQTSPVGVGMVSGPTGFWGLMDGRNRLMEVDPSDVIGRLRELKAG